VEDAAPEHRHHAHAVTGPRAVGPADILGPHGDVGASEEGSA
jgi:hypothetical protein